MQNKPLIYIVEDEEAIRDLYSCALSSAEMDSKCFLGSEEIYRALEKKIPDLIILDIMLDGEDGFDILSNLKNNRAYCFIPIIMVSAKTEEISKVKGLNMGASDYISKPFGVLELVARIKANLKKKMEVENIFIYKDIKIFDENRTVEVSDEKIFLTLKEYNLLKILLENSEKAVTREELLEKVWGKDFFGETRTLDMHILELRKKLSGAGSLAEIITIRGVGYILR